MTCFFRRQSEVRSGAAFSPLLLLVCLGIFIQISGLLFNQDGSKYATQLYFSLFMPSLFLFVVRKFDFLVSRQLSSILFFLLISWVFLVGVLHEGSVRDEWYWLKVVLLIFLYVYAVSVVSQRLSSFKVLVGCVFFVSALFAWLTLFNQYGVLDRPLVYPAVRSYRLFELGWGGLADLRHPVVAGLYYGVFIVLACWLFVCFPLRTWQVISLVFCVLGVALYVIFTFSRGAWFSVIFSALTLLIISFNRKSQVLLILGAAAGAVFLYLYWSVFLAEYTVGLSNRDHIWVNWFHHLNAFWISGAGAGAELFYRFSNGFEVVHAHSLYLQLWYEYGIVGISLFVALLLSLLWKGWQCREQPIARLGLALLVFAMVAMISDVYAVFHRPSPYWVIFWFPVGILLGVQRKPAASLG
jgi:putative inorganic carbon (HCO3(-)) transporter